MNNERTKIGIEDVLKMEHKFKTVITRYAIRSMDIEDIIQEFYLKILRQSDTDGLNYLERWDGSTTLSTWLYRPLLNLCKTIKTRENTEGGFAITTAMDIKESRPNGDDESIGTLFLDKQVSVNEEHTYMIFDTYCQLIRIAKERFKKYSSRSNKGIPRSTYNILILLFNGYTKAEVARKLGVSSTFIDSKVNEFKNDYEVILLKNEWFEISKEI